MFEVWIYKHRDSVFHRLDPLSKLIFIVSIALLALFFRFFVQHLAILVLLTAVSMLLARVSFPELVRGIWFFVAFSGLFFLFQVAFARTAGDIIIDVGFWALTTRGLDLAAASALRLLNMVLAAYIFVLSTHPRDLALALIQQLRIPYRWGYLAFFGFRLIPVIQRDFLEMRDAHKIRGVQEGRGLFALAQNVKRYGIPILATAIASSKVTVLSMYSRGFGAFPDRVYLHTIRMHWQGWLLIALSLSTVAVVIVWIVTTGGFNIGQFYEPEQIPR